MTEYKSPILVGYWRLKMILDLYTLEDSSLNPQYTSPVTVSTPLTFIYDTSYPVQCKYQTHWNSTQGYCVSLENTYEKMLKIQTNNQAFMKINTANMGNNYNVEFWYKADPTSQNAIIYYHTYFTVQAVNNGADLKVYRASDGSEMTHKNHIYDSKNWNHLLVFFYPDTAPSTDILAIVSLEFPLILFHL